MITGHELPQRADGLRGLFYWHREPAIFVRFKTDAEGISYILKTFGGPGLKLKRLDPETLKYMKAAHFQVFIGWHDIQQSLGVRLFDLDTVESGLLLDQTGRLNWQLGYRILVDDQKRIVYMAAWVL